MHNYSWNQTCDRSFFEVTTKKAKNLFPCVQFRSEKRTMKERFSMEISVLRSPIHQSPDHQKKAPSVVKGWDQEMRYVSEQYHSVCEHK